MGLLDSVVSAVGGSDPQLSGQAGLLPALIEQVNKYPGGLAGLIAKFQEGGLGDVIASWIGTGQNQPVSAQQLQSVLGDDMVDGLAQSANQDKDSVLNNLSAMLPSLVDHATPDGVVPEGKGLDVSSLLGSVSGLLGKL